MHCTSLEPKPCLGQGADLSILTAIKYTLPQAKSLYDIGSILTAIKYTLPQAKSLYDIGVCVMSAAHIRRAMLADFNSMKGGSI